MSRKAAKLWPLSQLACWPLDTIRGIFFIVLLVSPNDDDDDDDDGGELSFSGIHLLSPNGSMITTTAGVH